MLRILIIDETRATDWLLDLIARGGTSCGSCLPELKRMAAKVEGLVAVSD